VRELDKVRLLELEKEIESLKQQMFTTASVNDFTSDVVVKISQELDVKIVQYQKLVQEVARFVS
jgi:hypothetical protein